MNKRLITFILCIAPFLFFAQSLELDIELGKQNAEMVKAEMGIYQDAEKTAYLERVGQRLVNALDDPLFEYEFHLVPELSPNAFAIPGGHLYVTLGLLPILESEDELACILGHEIIHSNNRHAVKQMKKSILPKLLEVPGNLLGMINEDLGNLFNAPIATSNALLMASYGRGYESEADEEGVALAVKAGYDPNAMISALSRLSKTVEVATNYKEEKSYFSDHPYTPDRNKAIKKQMKSMNVHLKASETKSFLKEIDSVLFGAHPNQGVVKKQQFLHPDLNFFIQFPEKWNVENKPTSIGAYEPKQKAGAFLTFDDASLSPKQAASKFMEALEKDEKSKLVSSETYMHNGKEGYLLSFKDKVKYQTVYAHVIWIPMNGQLFKLMGIGSTEYKTVLQKTVESLRTLTKEEKESFNINYLRVVEANEGETIENLSDRVQNKLNLELTHTINAVEKGSKLKQGELIKVVKAYPYIPNK